MKTTSMPKELKEKWTAALRSGEYRQGYKALLSTNGAYCCLGVLQMVVDGKVEGLTGVRGYPSKEWLVANNINCLYNSGEHSWLNDILLGENGATVLNDNHRKTFLEIADLIETYVEGI